MKQKTVLGLGNILQRDEGLGVHALRMLQEQLGPTSSYDLVDGGVLGLNLLPLVEASSHLLILDAVMADRLPGTVIELGRDQIPLGVGQKLSPHQWSFQEVLALAKFRGRLPTRLRLIGAEPADTSLGSELSPVLRASLPEMTRRAKAVLATWDGEQLG